MLKDKNPLRRAGCFRRSTLRRSTYLSRQLSAAAAAAAVAPVEAAAAAAVEAAAAVGGAAGARGQGGRRGGAPRVREKAAEAAASGPAAEAAGGRGLSHDPSLPFPLPLPLSLPGGARRRGGTWCAPPKGQPATRLSIYEIPQTFRLFNNKKTSLNEK